MKALITGANRGIGLEFVRQLITQDVHVFAACRNPSKAGQLLKLQEDFPQQISIIQQLFHWKYYLWNPNLNLHNL